jgi:hypothetical protein
VESEVVDRSAYRGQDNSVYLPYSKNLYFYHEYKYFYDQQVENLQASESTFYRALKQLIKDQAALSKPICVKLSGGKGNFDKCDICHNADQLLQARNNWSEEQISIIESYRRRHIQQQFDERITLQNNIASTYRLDHNGQPVRALLFGDGMTVYTGTKFYS